MAQYIDKSALVAEIERRKEALETSDGRRFHSLSDQILWNAFNSIQDVINSLEGKEVDLNEYYHDFLQKEWFDKNCSRTVSEMMAFTAKHFFELGVNASNPLTWEEIKLIWTIGDEIPYMPEEDFFKELLKRFKAQKGE